MTGAEADPVTADPSRCGCAGKTPLDRVVRPALATLRDRLEGVRVAGDLEAGLLPNTAGLDRTVLDGDRGGATGGTGASRVVAAALVDTARGSDADALAATLGDAYETWGRGRDLTVLKGHSLQLEGATRTVVWGEQVTPTGRRRPGYRAVNVDVIHAVPGLSPAAQATVATLHALDDCYAQGATEERVVRPIVAAPSGMEPGPDRVRRWYDAGTPSGITVLDPAVVSHDGQSWQFGASASAVTGRRPPVRKHAVGPGDEVVIHRPLGALALYAGAVDETAALDSSARDRAVEALTADHVGVARAIAASCPAPNDRFDPTRHLTWAGDVSGPGIGGLARSITDESYGLHLESLPVLDPAGLVAVRDAWTVSDATVETNGPLVAVGSPAALDRYERRLDHVPGADPERIGRVTDGSGISWDPDVALPRYVEGVGRQQGQ